MYVYLPQIPPPPPYACEKHFNSRILDFHILEIKKINIAVSASSECLFKILFLLAGFKSLSRQKEKQQKDHFI